MRFEARRTVLYVESQILCPDAARPIAFAFGAMGTPHFSALTTYLWVCAAIAVAMA